MATAIVTGATGGIGRWIALGLAREGFSVVLLGRDHARLHMTRDWIVVRAPGAELLAETVDLSSLADTAAAARRLVVAHPAISILVNNAGMFSASRKMTAEGHDAVLAVNHLAPHVLTAALLPALLAGGPARIVNIGSSTSDRARIDPDDLELRARWGMVRSYSQSKLALMMATFARARRLVGTGVTANVVHPGAVATGLIRAGGPIGLAWRLMSPFLLTEAQGADTPVHACVGPAFATLSGVYIKRRQVVAPNPLALDDVLIERVWAATERLVAAPGAAGVSPGGPAPGRQWPAGG